MNTQIKATENTIVEENANYVLGMFDLYQNDAEIIEALKLKGLDYHIIQQVLSKIKQPSYKKRMRQSKRLAISGAVLVGVLWLISFLLNSLPGAQNLLNGKDVGEGMLRGLFRIYREFYYFIIYMGIVQVIAGVIVFYKYKKLLRQDDSKTD
jgi:hypothetical protein